MSSRILKCEGYLKKCYHSPNYHSVSMIHFSLLVFIKSVINSAIEVRFASALLLSLVATISACGASGVAGGSLLLTPLASSLFSIPNDIAMQVVAIGFIIGVVQDSAETALNSSTDVLFTAAADPKCSR